MEIFYFNILCVYKMEIEQLLRKHKVLYKPFMETVATESPLVFLRVFRHPFFVGKDLYEGVLSEKTLREANPTMKFQGTTQEDESNIPSVSLDKHLFYVYPSSKEKQRNQAYSIGRTSDNDIVIVDYTVSKTHARLVKNQNQFYLQCLGATNGTSINNNRIETNGEDQVMIGDSVAFGRLSFVFLKPITVFFACREIMQMEKITNQEFQELVKFIRRDVFDSLARRNEMDTEDASKNDLVRALLGKYSSWKLIEEIF